MSPVMTAPMMRAHERMLATLPVHTYSRMRDEPAPGVPPKKSMGFMPGMRIRYRGTTYPSFKKLQAAKRCGYAKICRWIARGEARYV